MKIIDTIFCDEIREEVRNKISLLGIYDSHLIFYINEKEKDKWPRAMKLCTYIRISRNERDPLPNKFRIDFRHNDESLISASGDFDFKPSSRPRIISLLLRTETFPLKGPGTLDLKVNLYKDQDLIFEDSPEYKLIVVESHPVVT